MVSLGLTGVALDQAYRQDTETLTQTRLQAQVVAVLGAAEIDEQGRVARFQAPPDPRFATPESGLYARVRSSDGTVLWRSGSWLDGQRLQFPVPSGNGAAAEGMIPGVRGARFFVRTVLVPWEDLSGEARSYRIEVAEDTMVFDRAVAGFRRSLTVWFGIALLAMAVVQSLVLAFGLAPLRAVTRELRAIERGERDRIEGDYPRELAPLVRALNGLIDVSGRRLERYRNGLADLAHSLKTPLAVMRGAGGSGEDELRQAVHEQVERMDRAVSYQLSRASATGGTVLGPPIAVGPAVESMVRTLGKVYADRRIEFHIEVAEDCSYPVDDGDLTELLGNLMDNACKWARSSVRVSAALDQAGGLELVVEDDGPGMAAEHVEALLTRGGRADPDVPGQGIGLAVVVEMVREAHGGTFEVSRSAALGGACVAARLPPRR